MGELRENKKRETRQRISNVATELFFARGFDAVTIEEIAAAANVSKMTVSNYLARKEDLMLDREDDLQLVFFREALRARPKGQSPIAALRPLVDRLREQKHPYARIDSQTVGWWRVVAASPTLKARLREIADEAAEGLAIELAGPQPDSLARLAAGMVVLTLAHGAREEAMQRVRARRLGEEGERCVHRIDRSRLRGHSRNGGEREPADFRARLRAHRTRGRVARWNTMRGLKEHPNQEHTLVYDVIIAGAGPVGLFLACELRLAKLSVLVLEQLEDPHSPLKRLPFGLRGLWGPSTERHPVGARILDWTRAQVASMRPDRQSRALQAILRDLIDTRDGATYFAERVWGVSLRYDLGEAHPLVGKSCPDFELEDGTKVGPLLRDGSGLLLDFGRQLQALDGVWGDRVRYVASDAKERLGLRALLVRPDGFVAWASDTTPSPEDVTRAAASWFASREPHAMPGVNKVST